jgi:hypothetical protein
MILNRAPPPPEPPPERPDPPPTGYILLDDSPHPFWLPPGITPEMIRVRPIK